MTSDAGATPAADRGTKRLPSGEKAAALVGAGILLSRLLGLVRVRAMAHFLGASDATDAFTAAFRVPNALQNLLGEGVLSAAFIPVYAGLHGRGDDEARREVASAILALLVALTSALVLIGIVAAPWLVTLTAAGFTGEKRELTIRLIRILFPGAAVFVLSAWCLGVLNSHGRFFLSYVSAVFWNVAMIATLLAFGGRESDDRLVMLLAWGSVAGSLLQFGVQLPSVRRILGTLRPRWRSGSAPVATVVRNFLPVSVGRGVAQLSAFVDSTIASFLGSGAVGSLGFAQALYILPVSLFAMSVSAAELPMLSSVVGASGDVSAVVRQRVQAGLGRIAFFVVPSAVAFLALGGDLAELVYGSGRFGPAEARWVWGILAGASVGLLASTLGRLYASAFYALRDPAMPLRFAVARVTVSAALAVPLAFVAPGVLGIDARWGVAGITVASGLAGWIEFLLLRRALSQRIGPTGLSARTLIVLWSAAALAAAAGWGARLANAGAPMLLRTTVVIALFGLTYWVVTWRMGIVEAVELWQRVFRRRGR